VTALHRSLCVALIAMSLSCGPDVEIADADLDPANEECATKPDNVSCATWFKVGVCIDGHCRCYADAQCKPIEGHGNQYCSQGRCVYE